MTKITGKLVSMKLKKADGTWTEIQTTEEVFDSIPKLSEEDGAVFKREWIDRAIEDCRTFCPHHYVIHVDGRISQIDLDGNCRTVTKTNPEAPMQLKGATITMLNSDPLRIGRSMLANMGSANRAEVILEVNPDVDARISMRPRFDKVRDELTFPLHLFRLPAGKYAAMVVLKHHQERDTYPIVIDLHADSIAFDKTTEVPGVYLVKGPRIYAGDVVAINVGTGSVRRASRMNTSIGRALTSGNDRESISVATDQLIMKPATSYDFAKESEKLFAERAKQLKEEMQEELSDRLGSLARELAHQNQRSGVWPPHLKPGFPIDEPLRQIAQDMYRQDEFLSHKLLPSMHRPSGRAASIGAQVHGALEKEYASGRLSKSEEKAIQDLHSHLDKHTHVVGAAMLPPNHPNCRCVIDPCAHTVDNPKTHQVLGRYRNVTQQTQYLGRVSTPPGGIFFPRNERECELLAGSKPGTWEPIGGQPDTIESAEMKAERVQRVLTEEVRQKAEQTMAGHPCHCGVDTVGGGLHQSYCPKWNGVLP